MLTMQPFGFCVRYTCWSLSYPFCLPLVFTSLVVEGSVWTRSHLWFQPQFWWIFPSKLSLNLYQLHPTSSVHIHISTFATGPLSKPENLVGLHARTAHIWGGSWHPWIQSWTTRRGSWWINVPASCPLGGQSWQVFCLFLKMPLQDVHENLI